MLVGEKAAIADEAHAEVARIVESEQFRSSEVLQRLLLFLTERSLAGEAHNLKEYVIAIDGLGKAPSYDPQHHSAVRIQVGRLRQRLTEYYRNEGKNDPLLVELPKGHFRLTFRRRPPPISSVQDDPLTSSNEPPPITTLPVSPDITVRPTSWRMSFVVVLAILLLVGAGYLLGRASAVHVNPQTANSQDLAVLWAPFLNSRLPLILSIEDPLFAEIRSDPGVYFRDRSMNDWRDMVGSSALSALAGALKQSEIRPSRYYTAFGEAEASFLLGGLLRSQERPLSLVRSSQLSWQQIADNNLVFVGVQNLFFNQVRNMPIIPQLVPELNGVSDKQPQSGQARFYADSYTTAPSEQGVVYALITHVPGPNGKNDILSFTSNRSAGYLAAVQSFTDPHLAALLKSKLVQIRSHEMPRSYQLLLQVHYRDGVPTETVFVLARELH